MPRILAAATAVPPHRLDQPNAKVEMARICSGHPHLERLVPVFDRSGVETRYLVHLPEWYVTPRTFDERNCDYKHQALALAEAAIRTCLTRASLAADEIDHIYFVTTTGLTTPSLDAVVAAKLGMRPDVRRTPVFGLGCAGGAGALTRACDVLRQEPDARALVVSVELCSLVFSTKALTATDLVGVALFGDGGAAVVLGGDEVDGTGGGPVVAGTRSHLFTDAPDLMGWNFTGDGMRLVLSRDIPEFVAARVVPVIDEFLDEHRLTAPALQHYLLHPGGPKVMATYRGALGLSESDLRHARTSMRQYGNLSSASVLFMLSDLLASGAPSSGDRGLMLALGPGFAAEMLLLAW